ncbi:MAG: division/cell wall cluster transcriptional repressor MraZ [Firmicutes bacterium]|nr:division/cell wall cluster transcriptional repressor MraZ [Bacillota bacterium]
MFCGEYSHAVDSKNRIILPSKLREQLGEQVVLTKSVDKCLSLYPSDAWTIFTEKLDTLPATETRKVKRFLYAAAFETQIDGQGRILLPPNLCEYAGISKNVRVAGVGDHVEIWDEALWNAELGDENASEIADTLLKLGF